MEELNEWRMESGIDRLLPHLKSRAASLTSMASKNKSYLEVVYGVEAINGRHSAEFQAEQQGAVVGAGVADILPHQHEVGPSDINTFYL